MARLKDAENETNSLDSRFDLAYSAAHAPCLGALRYQGFRPSKRYIVFQVLPDTLGLGAEVWRVLSKCHDMRNQTEYEGALDVDDRLVADLVSAWCPGRARQRTVTTSPFRLATIRLSGECFGVWR
jgi:hypothetical protein